MADEGMSQPRAKESLIFWSWYPFQVGLKVIKGPEVTSPCKGSRFFDTCERFFAVLVGGFVKRHERGGGIFNSFTYTLIRIVPRSARFDASMDQQIC